MTGLSKSRYTAFCQCRKRLWLKVYKPDEEVLDAGAQSRFENGHIVGKLAQNLFVPNVDIDATSIFPKMQSMSAADADATRKALLAYCCLDTLALVKVLERLEKVSI